MQLVVKNGTVVSPAGSRRAHVLVDRGIVVAVTERDDELPNAQQVIDADGLHVLPGLVDPDVNFRDPGLEYKEGWPSGSTAAVCGGVTTVLDMPNTARPIRDRDAVIAKVESAAGASYCDFAVKASIVPDNLDRIADLADAGVCGYRFSLAGTAGAIEGLTSGEVLQAWVAETGLRCGVHPETREIVNHFRLLLQRQGRNDPKAWRDARPPVAEAEGVARCLALAESTGIKLALYHVSAKESVDWVRRSKQHGQVDLVAETNPHYCVVDGTELEAGLGSMLTMMPPIRTVDHADAVLDALADGTIDVLGTDHSPHTADEKNYLDRTSDIWKSTPGWPGLETTVSLMLTAVSQQRLSIERYVGCQAEEPARAWSLWPRKGALRPGSDADITIVDLHRTGRFDEATLHSRHPLSPFHGRAFTGAPVYTVLRGVLTAADGELVSTHPDGHWIRPSSAGR